MAREVPEIDRLIEEGLTLYGQGALDEALLRWEKALAIDPDNAQANSYVDYVRANYELLTSDLNGERTQESAPFGIADDEPEYHIEIQPGEIKASMPEISPPLFMDPLDEGWTIEDEQRDTIFEFRKGPPSIGLAERPSQHMTLELEADEPPPTPPQRPEVSFDDTTREYSKKQQMARAPSGGFDEFAQSPTPAPASEFGPDGTPGFGHPNDFQTPPGFGSQATGVKARELGFVTPIPATTATGLGLPERPPQPQISEDADTMQRAPITAADLEELDLISSLPSPRPAPQPAKVEVETPLSGAAQPKGITRELPNRTRAPAFSAAPTKELPEASVAPAISAAQTQDFDVKTKERKGNFDQTSEIPGMAQAAQLAPDPVVSAPTRDLGLRDAAALGRAQPVVPDRELRAGEGTRSDVVLPFDPIDARAAEILEDVDEGAPRTEQREDKTRRRITTLFEKASTWSAAGDLERAVAAVDLALSEDPNSALAQKLIHRNRETIMAVFQAYLGPLDRTPQLARPLHELASAPISPRAAFLLSRIDGLLTIDEILDVCGMPRLEAYRYLCQLFLRNILR